ncbi:MAG: trimethylamine methyltransferase family protein, partial [Phycisphaerae bacterium]|nr:trimethylamine methyltransferase family protein [Phycisphaerae bacterium]
IDEVGPGGHFMGHEHTLQNYKKEVWYPELLERDNYDNWFGRGGKDITERASEKAQALLDTHQPRPLDDAKSKEIDKIVSP